MGRIVSYPLHIGESLLRKYHYVVACNHHSVNQQIVLLIHRAVRDFEAIHGEITAADLEKLANGEKIR